MPKSKDILWLRDITVDDINLIGQNFSKLSEISNKFNVPQAFVIPYRAFSDFLSENNLYTKIKHLLSTVNFDNPKSIAQVSEHITNLILSGSFDKKFVNEVAKAYLKLGSVLKEPIVNLYFSVDLKSYPINLHSFKNIEGDAVLIEKIKTYFALIFNEKLLSEMYRTGLSVSDLNVSVLIQSKLNAKYNGALFTSKPDPFNKSKIEIKVTGQGDIEIDKPDVRILQNDTDLSEKNILSIAKVAKEIEQYFYFPQSLEWAMYKNAIYIQSFKDLSYSKENESQFVLHLDPILGFGINKGIASGTLKFINNLQDVQDLKSTNLAVLNFFDNNIYKYLTNVQGLILQSLTLENKETHLLRLLSVPVVSLSDTTVLNPKLTYTINGTTGQITPGGAYRNPDLLNRSTATKIYANTIGLNSLDNIELTQADGLVIIDGNILIKEFGMHPKKIINEEKEKQLLEFIYKNISQIVKKNNPNKIIYKISDLTTQEHIELIGGKDYEIQELNPHFGYRGGLRHSLDGDILEIELGAINKALKENSLLHIEIMFSFVRTILEFKNLLNIVERMELDRFSNFKTWLMIQTPFNLLMLEEFIELGAKGICIDFQTLISFMFGYDLRSLKIYDKISGSNAIENWILQRAAKISQKNNIECVVLDNDLISKTDLIDKIISSGISAISVLPNQIEEVKTLLQHYEKRLLYK